jgi:hypothetical protein
MRPEIAEHTAGFPGGLENFNDLDSKCAMTHLRNVLTTAKTQIAAIKENFVGIGSNIRSFSIREKHADALDSADLALSGIDALIKHTFGKISPLMAFLEKVMRHSETGLVKIDEATADIVKAMTPCAPALMRIQNALEEVERASRGVKECGNGLEHSLLSAPPRKGSQLINIHLNLPYLMIVRCCGVFTPVKDPNFYHVLDPLVTDRTITHSPPSMAVNSPSFPRYLTLEQLVTRSGGKLMIRSVDLWAERLDTGMTRVTASNYSQLTAPPNMQPVEHLTTLDYAALLELKITRFEPDDSNTMTFQETWTLQPVKRVETRGQFSGISTSISSPSPQVAARVNVMNQCLAHLARQITNQSD